MNKALTLSIVIPVYNEEIYLEDCLKAIEKQSMKPDEVIVIDNNSTDKSVEIANKFTFVKVVHEPKPSVLYARTKGYNTAKSDIIGRIDADTIVSKNWVKELHRLFQDSELSAVTGAVNFHDMPFSSYNHLVDHFFKGPLHKYAKDFPFLFGTNMAFRRSVWVDLRDELCSTKDIHEDLDLAIHLHLANKRIDYDPALRAGMSARRYDDSLSAFLEYQEMFIHTFRTHDMKILAPKLASNSYTLGYFLLWPLRKSYNPLTKKRTVKHLLTGQNKPRKNPMH